MTTLRLKLEWKGDNFIRHTLFFDEIVHAVNRNPRIEVQILGIACSWTGVVVA
jgi:hypothetical protein